MPTVFGWRTHEWLWQSVDGEFPEVVNIREGAVKNFYTTTDINVAKEFIETYDVSYIYIGKKSGCLSNHRWESVSHTAETSPFYH